MIELSHLTKTYPTKTGPVTALEDINLKIEDGDIYGIIGLSGAGKSTLVRCMNGLEKFQSGELLYNGEPVTFDAAYRRKVTMIFQQFNLLQQRTVLKNVELVGELVGDPDRTEKAKKLLAAVGLSDKLSSYPSQLSGGQQQRVAIARALMTDPEVLLCDEATSALDPDTTKSILDLLKELNRTMGITVVIISHQMSVIEAICTKVAIIDKSHIVESGRIEDVFLSPKTQIAKKLVYSGHIFVSDPEKKFIKVMFSGGVDVPVVADLVRDKGIPVSILYAESREIGGTSYGQIVLEPVDYERDVPALRAYLDGCGVRYEEVTGNEFC